MQPDATQSTTRRPLLVPIILGGVVVVVVLAILGGWLFVRSQYYVGVSQGDVAIYRGVPGSVGPLHLSSVTQRGVALDSLQPEAQRLVEGKITTSSHSGAERILSEIESQTLSSSNGITIAPSASPSTSPSTNPSATPAGSTAPTATATPSPGPS